MAPEPAQPVTQLETARLLLRQWRESDLDAFAAMMRHPEVASFLSADRRPLDRIEAWRSMALFAGHWALKGYGLFVLEEKATGAFIGRVGLWRPEGWPGLELGWALARPYWGRGFAYEAARAAGAWALAAFPLDRLVSLIHVENRASQRLAARLGMRRGAQTWHAGMPHALWAVPREEWAP